MTTVRLAFLVIVMCMLDATGVLGQALPAAPGLSLMPAGGLESLALQGSQKDLASVEMVDVTGQPFARVIKVTTRAGATSPWNIQLRTVTAGGIKAGDVLLAKFWLRCTESMTGDGFVGVVLELAKPEFDKAVETRVAAGATWRECFVPFQAKRDFPAGEAQICLRFGFDRQTVEIGGLDVLNYGTAVKLADLPRTKITYAGRNADAQWRKDALERIEKIRKGDLTVRVVDASGKPLPGAKVHLALRQPAFGFGSCVTTDLLTGDSPDAKKFREIVEKYFSLAVFENDMKWPALFKGFSLKTDEALQWLLDRNIPVRGHNLIWPSWQWLPPELKAFKTDPEELRRRAAAHVTDTVTHYKGKLFQWDVVNEPFTNHDLMDLFGGGAVKVMGDWFQLARQADPASKLYLNDFGILEGGASNEHRKHFFDTIKQLKESDAPIDGIGIQSHFGSDLPPPTQLLAVLDQFSTLGLPIESTEFSLNLEDRELQADYLRDYMIALFSHPNVNGIMLWGFWEGRHWRPQAALFNKDWSIRPAGQAWIDLVHGQWTTDVEVVADDQGRVNTRGFHGEYDINVTEGSRSGAGKAQLSGDSAETTITVK